MTRADLKYRISDGRTRRPAAGSVAACVVLTVLLTSTTFAAEPAPAKPPVDGAILTAGDGKLIPGGAADLWFFELVADVNTVNGPIVAGTRFELLPCTTLEAMVADVNDRFTPLYRLTARVTRYSGKSFLFPSYFLPLSKPKSGESTPEPGHPPVLRPPVNTSEPDPELTIPQEVLDKLKERQFVRGAHRKSGDTPGPPSQKSPARTLADAVGKITPASPGHYVFVPDAFGWSVGGTRYELLPCLMLEQTLQMQAASPEPLRFSVVGLVTEFKGRKYLLLQRVIRAYGHGNFIK